MYIWFRALQNLISTYNNWKTLTWSILCQSWDFNPYSCSTPLFLVVVNAPFNDLMHPVGVRKVVMACFTYFSSFFDITQGAGGRRTCPPFSRGQAWCIHPATHKSSRTLTLSRLPITCSQILDPTFLKMCMGSRRWLILRWVQYGSRKKMEYLHKGLQTVIFNPIRDYKKQDWKQWRCTCSCHLEEEHK